MIILSGVLVVVAIALLVAGIVAGNGDSAQVFGLDALVVIYISIAVSIVSALCLAIGVFLRRKELFGGGAPPAVAKRKAKDRKRRRSAPPAPAKGAGSPQEPVPPAEPAADDEVEIPVQPVDVPDDAVVFVVRGRKRYHLDTCRQLAGRDTEELTYAEAKEEGFSPCTACMPDTALAARAAVSVPASADASRAGESPKPGGERSPSRSESGPAGLGQPSPYIPPAPQSTRPSPAVGFEKPAGFEKTAEIPRASHERASHESGEFPSAGRDAGTPSSGTSSSGTHRASPAGPTLTDLPVGGPGPADKSADKPLSAPETALDEPVDAERRSEPERFPAADSAPGDATVDLGPAPASVHGTTAPRPRDTDEYDAPASDRSRSDDPLGSTGIGEPEPASDPAPSSDPEPAAEADPEAPTGPVDVPADDDGPQVRILSGTKRYHRVDCALIEDIGDEADDLESLSRTEAKARGCTPCLVCQPDR
ncbi:hypothetical protein [Actinomadura fibrosa]|uniref:hypothetical protein n=1 Tax=Actinomadura fibrosa TaxID=111802 RepID=UPI0013F15965|nr:hypothetical protein [Actinomadura fibrosa]